MLGVRCYTLSKIERGRLLAVEQIWFLGRIMVSYRQITSYPKYLLLSGKSLKKPFQLLNSIYSCQINRIRNPAEYTTSLETIKWPERQAQTCPPTLGKHPCFPTTARERALTSPTAYSHFTKRISFYNPASLCMFKNLELANEWT